MKILTTILKITTSLILFTIASLFASQAALAQIVLTKNSFDAFLNGQFSFTGLSSSDDENIIALLKIKGANQTWDFTTLTYDRETYSALVSRESFSSATGTPGAGDEHFEQATHTIRSSVAYKYTDNGEEDDYDYEAPVYIYSIINDDQFLVLGVIETVGEPEWRKYRPGDVVFTFPTTYGTSWSNNYEEVYISGNSNNIDSSVEVDGWGELITPNGTFNVLRITRIEPDGNYERIDVSFWGAEGFPIAFLSAEKRPFSDEYEYPGASLNVYSTGTSNPREIASERPDRAALHQNYPNPFNPSTIITYDLAEAATVSLDIYSITGIRVMPVISERTQQAGRYSVSVNASSLASGVYIYQFRTGSQILTRKMTLIK